MSLNGAGPISIGGSNVGQSINLELGRSAGTSSNLNESALRTLAGVASGAISLANFYGKSSGGAFSYVNLTGVSFSSTTVSSALTASLTFNTDGTISLSGGTTNSLGVTAWGTPTGAGTGTGRYFRITATSGAFTSGTTGSFQQLNANRTYTLSTTANISTSVTFTIDTSNDGTTVLNTWTGIVLTANGSSSITYTNLTGLAFTSKTTNTGFTSTLTFNSDGTISLSGGGTNTLGSTTWGTPTGTGVGTYKYLKITPTSGSFTSGTTGTFQQLNTSRTYTLATTAGNVSNVTFTINTSNDGTTTLNTWTGTTLTADGSAVFTINLPTTTFTQWAKSGNTGTITTSIQLNPDGTITLGSGVIGTTSWGTPTGGTPGNLWWVKATTISGSIPSGTVGSWLQLNTARSWSLSVPIVAFRYWDFKLDFSTDGGTTIAYTAGNLELYVEKTN